MRARGGACALADLADAVVLWLGGALGCGQGGGGIEGEGHVVADADGLIERLRGLVSAGDHVVFMSNGGFDGAPRRFHAVLRDA